MKLKIDWIHWFQIMFASFSFTRYSNDNGDKRRQNQVRITHTSFLNFTFNSPCHPILYLNLTNALCDFKLCVDTLIFHHTTNISPRKNSLAISILIMNSFLPLTWRNHQSKSPGPMKSKIRTIPLWDHGICYYSMDILISISTQYE